MDQVRQKNENGIKRQKSRNERPARMHHTSSDPSTARNARAPDNLSAMFSHQYQRDASASPPPSITYSYPSPDPVIHAPYPQHAPYHNSPSAYPDYPNQQVYLPPLPVTLPSMSPYELGLAKNDSLFDGDDMLSQFNISYSPMNSVDTPFSQHYQELDPNVIIPDLSYQLY